MPNSPVCLADVDAGGLAEHREALERALRDLADAHVELARRQAFTDALLETIGVGIVSCGADGSGWLRNSAERAMLGLKPAAASGVAPEAAAPLMDILDVEGNRVAVEDYPLVRALHGEQVGSVELLLGPAGGPHREVISHSSRILDPNGEVLGAVSALTDVSAERAAARALTEERHKLTEAQRLSKLGSFAFDPATGGFTYSEQLMRNWGVQPGDDLAALAPGLIHAGDRALVQRAWEQLLVDGGHREYLHRIVRSGDGQVRYLRTNVEARLDVDGGVVELHGTQLDVTELTTAVQAAQTATAFFDAVLAATPDYTFVTDLATGAVIYGSPAKDVLGISSAELGALGKDAALALIHPEDRQQLRSVNSASADLADGLVLQLRYRGRHTDGEWHWLNRRVTPFRRDESGRVVEVLGVVRDVSDVVHAEERLSHAALHDGLTGLPNRELLMDRLETALARSGRDGRDVSVIFCDLDGFKDVNDSAGHAAGDAVLIETGRRLVSVLREEDTVARVGGDEFVIVVEPWNRMGSNRQGSSDAGSARAGAADRSDARSVAARIAEVVRQPLEVDGGSHHVSASIGMTHASRKRGAAESLSAETVLQQADAAMYRAKRQGKGRVEVN